MPDKHAVIEELNFVTDLLSNRSRTLAGGVLAISWVLLLANATGSEGSGVVDSRAILAPILFALLSLLADLAQYWAGYLFAKRHLIRMERQQKDFAEYDYDSSLYKWRAYLFYSKIGLMLTSVVVLLVLLSVRFIE